MGSPYNLNPPKKPSVINAPHAGSISLLNPEFKLKLDPQIRAEMEALGLLIIEKKPFMLFEQPDWSKLEQDWRFQRMLTAPQPQSPPAKPPAKGPDKPRAGEVSDLVKAVGKLPVVKNGVKHIEEQGKKTVESIWNGANTGEKALLITHTTLLASGVVAGILARQDTRQKAFSFIEGKNLPVPGIEGLSFRVRRTGGGITSPFALPGMNLSYDVDLKPGMPQPQIKLFLNFDLMEFLRKRRQRR
ncbi:MAG: hypothetical protein V2J55_03860 [Candidatus Competibacteraceae bacterium]|jgi:hypothetical protein|nr:hypothetical protein [Candidatus Competibacteraceae bacterium]